MERDVEVQDAPAGMFDNEEAVQGRNNNGNGEEIRMRRWLRGGCSEKPTTHGPYVRPSRFGDVETEL